MANKKRKKKKPIPVSKNKAIDKKLLFGNIIRLLSLIAVTMVVFGLYRFLLTRIYFEYVLIVYMTVATISILGYVIYNRGFSRQGLTPEMLPDDMSKQEKEDFIEDGKRRLKRSRPLLIICFAFAFTFIFDVIELVVLPFFKEMLVS